MTAEITLLVTWPAQDNADGYRVRLLDAQGAELQLQDVATTIATFGPLAELTTYQLELVAYHNVGESDPQLLTVTTPQGEAGASSLVVTWEGAASGDTARLLDGAGTELQDLGAVTSPLTLSDLATDTAYQLELTRADATVEVIAFTTPLDLPGGVSGIQHTFATDSLTFTWDAATDAAEYLLTLSRDGTEVATQTVTELTATFGTLEDGTQYDLTIQATNAVDSGPIAYYQATTGYIAPAAPTNLRQFEERIIAVICRWDLAEPDKVFDVEVQLLYGTDLVLADALTGAATERTIIVPMASTDYLLRVRAGNPGGWSDWAEATVSTEVFPIIDSRLAVMAAGYQEDVLHTDTWDGSSDQLKGVVEQLSAEAVVEIDGYELAQTYQDPVVLRIDAEDSLQYSALFTVGDVTSRPLLFVISAEDVSGYKASFSVGDFTAWLVKKDTSADDYSGYSATFAVGVFTTAQVRFVYYGEDSSGYNATFVVGDFTIDIP